MAEVGKRQQANEGNGRDSGHEADAGQPADVMLKVPRVNVDEVQLDVEQLTAHVSLEASVAERLVHIRAGVDVDLGNVELSLKGVDTEAELRVKLENIARIAEEALSVLREHSELAQVLGGTTITAAARRVSPARPARQLAGSARRAVGGLRESRYVKRIRETPRAAARTAARTVVRGLSQVTHAIPAVSQRAVTRAERGTEEPRVGDLAGGAAHARTDGWSGLPGV